MNLAIILASIMAAGLLGFITNIQWRIYLLLTASVLAVYILQPSLPIRSLDFYLPSFTVGLAVLGWVLTSPRESRSWKTNWPGAVISSGIVLLLALTRYLGFTLPLTPSRPPQFLAVLVIIVVFVVASFIITLFTRRGKIALSLGFLVVLVFFLFLKVPSLTVQVSIFLRSLTNQSVITASSLDIRWLGYSYIAFRMMHTIRDRQSGRLPPVTLAEYIIYIIFFPCLSAGPIDRIERFVGDLRNPHKRTTEDWTGAGRRIVVGLFKKFILSDGLAMIALSATNAMQIKSTGWAWIMLYAYSFQLFFDFSGYTDIAIGTAKLIGFTLPENFNSPYLKPNLTQFWNNWHMTLTQWFRAYFFNPVTRALRTLKYTISIPAIILITQIGTMVLIGMWHGVTINFIIWGFWHGIGLFIHNRWSDLTKSRFALMPNGWQRVLNACGVIITFHYIAIGWVFFALPLPSISWNYLLVLFGNA